jgi:glycosyltransferase involved in cell wall biosynthesis
MKVQRSAVSIVIPCYNLGEFLQEAVDSCLQQTRTAAEIIIVDDGSTDEATRELMDSYRQSELVEIVRTPNRGAPAARNLGVRRAHGDYILCLDADDALEPRFLERTVPVLDARANVGVVATGVHMFGTFEGDWRPGDYAPITMLWRNCIPSASLFRRICWEQAGGYPDLPASQDWGFWIGIIRNGWKWQVVPDVLYRYRRRAGSISDYREENRADVLRRLIDLHGDFYRKHAVDVHVEMDAELNRLQQTIRNQANRIAQLEGRPGPAQPDPPAPELLEVDQPRTVHHTFSVIICTYNRADMLATTLESVFAQEYPRDCFEIIVVDNNSPDDTAGVVRDAAARSPVPLSYHIEPRNGLSHARNLGIAQARHEYVAFLDDDATACTGWLAAFNDVINQHHALVVGGRVEHVYDAGFAPPDWFQFPYLRGFFGINYRDRGKQERVFRIRSPHYIGGGNSAYARRLFQYFGGYDAQLGRDAKTLLAAEETYLNRVMERADVPIFYTNDAVIHHYVSPARMRRSHLLRKAYWSGFSSVITSVLFDGYPNTRARTKSHRRELRRLLKQVAGAPRDPEVFSLLCRATYHMSYLASFWRVEMRRVLFGRVYRPQHTPTWGAEEWIREIEAWPDTEDKYRHLYDVLIAVGAEQRARAALDRLSALRPDGADAAGNSVERLRRPLLNLEYRRMLDDVRATVDALVPAHGRVLVISRGDDALLQLGGRAAAHFPQVDDGTYAGHHPQDSAEAIRHLEALQARGFDYLVVPRTAYWWFDHYVEFREYLEQHFALTVDAEAPCLVIPVPEPAVFARWSEDLARAGRG